MCAQLGAAPLPWLSGTGPVWLEVLCPLHVLKSRSVFLSLDNTVPLPRLGVGTCTKPALDLMFRITLEQEHLFQA